MLRHPYPGNGAVDHRELDDPRGVLGGGAPYPVNRQLVQLSDQLLAFGVSAK